MMIYFFSTSKSNEEEKKENFLLILETIQTKLLNMLLLNKKLPIAER